MSSVAPRRKPRGAGRDPHIMFRAPQDLLDAIRRTASHERVTVSELLRSAATQRVGLDKEEAAPPQGTASKQPVTRQGNGRDGTTISRR
jgi:hypothetical protein